MSWTKDFKAFVVRGSLLDLAIGFTVGAAFSTVAKSLVSDVVMPPIGYLLGNADFSDLFLLLRSGKSGAASYATLAAAQADGAITINYGIFANNVVALLLVALAMFWLVRLVKKANEELDEHFQKPAASAPADKKCPHCRMVIDYQAVRCPYCTSQLEPPRESVASA